MTVSDFNEKGETGNVTTEIDNYITISPLLTLGKESDLFVGSFPAGKVLPPGLTSRTYLGSIDELVIDGEVVGLWDYKVGVPSDLNKFG